MRIVILSLFALMLIKAPALAQTPSKREMQAQMLEAVNEVKKEIAELESQIKAYKSGNPEEVTNLQQQLALLKSQLAMMQGLDKSLARMPEKMFSQANGDSILTLNKDVSKIKKTLPGSSEPVTIDRQLPKADSVEKARNDVDYSKIELCTQIDDEVNLPPRPPYAFNDPLPKIKPNGELDYTSSRKDALSLITDLMWLPGETITVGMDLTTNNTSAIVASKVEQYAKVWETVANIHFDFVPDISTAQVRIGFDPKKGTWSRMGRRVLYNIIGENTMNFGWLTDTTRDQEFSRVVLHEFGHVLGFIHEHQSPVAGIQWNTEVLYHYYKLTLNWTKEEVDKQIILKYSGNATNSSVYDKQSIMHYFYRPELTLNQESFPINRELSIMDKAFAGVVYPFPQQPSDASGTLETGDDCDIILFSVDYDAVDPNVIEFILEAGLDHHGNRITWWKRIGIPTKGGPEVNIDMVDGNTATTAIPDAIIDKDKGISFWKAKFLGVHTKLAYKWDVLPAVPGGTRIRLTWQRDTCK